jgi:hypothetical protein
MPYRTIPRFLPHTCEACKTFSNSTPYTHVLILLTYLLTYSMLQDILWKADSYSRVHYRTHKSPPPDPILSQTNRVRLIDPYLPKIHLNIVLPPTPRSSQLSFPSGLPNQNPLNTTLLPHACHMSVPLLPP